jgi:hypothetical protein
LGLALYWRWKRTLDSLLRGSRLSFSLSGSLCFRFCVRASLSSLVLRLTAKLALILRALYFLLVPLFIPALHRDGARVLGHLRSLARR